MPFFSVRDTNLALKTACYAACILLFLTSCQEVDTIKRELLAKVQGKLLKKKNPFVPRDGITIRNTPLFQTANPNSDVLYKLPAESTVHLVDRIGEFYRVRTPDGKEGYIETKVVGGEDIVQLTQNLRNSIEGIPPQAEGVLKTNANFRLQPGRNHEVIEKLPAGKKIELYERVVTVRTPAQSDKSSSRGKNSDDAEEQTPPDMLYDDVKKDVWYKVKIEDGRVGFIYTHNISLTPPEDIARQVPYMRIVAWRPITTTDDADLGSKNNYLVAYAPIGKDPGSDYTRLYLFSWSPRLKRRTISWQTKLSGILPITNYQAEGKPGFNVRYLHPTKKNKLVLAGFVLTKGTVKRISEEEIPNPSLLH